jgi:hypothetical protein
MPLIYNEVFWITVLFVFLCFSLVPAAILKRRTQLPKVLIIVASMLISSTITLTIGFRLASLVSDTLQATIAQPYIQQALDKHCKLSLIAADTKGFSREAIPYGDSEMTAGFSLGWHSPDDLVQCSYYPRTAVWECLCPNK